MRMRLKRERGAAGAANWGGSAGLRSGTPTAEPRGDVGALVVITALVLGGVAGFAFGADREIGDGIVQQYAEAQTREDWTVLDALPEFVPRVFLTVVDPGFEDRRFITSADDESAVSRELVRQVHRLDATPGGRAREFVMAPLLEGRLSRRQLLELYLNRVRMGRDGEWTIYGITQASREYFGKEPAELTLSETATLAGLLLPPRMETPADHVGAVGARRNEVLRQLLNVGVIDEEAFRAATGERLGFQPGLQFAPMAPPPPREGEDAAVIRLNRPIQPVAED